MIRLVRCAPGAPAVQCPEDRMIPPRGGVQSKKRVVVSVWEANPNTRKKNKQSSDGVGWTNPARKRRGLMRATSGRLPIRSLAASGHRAIQP